MNNKFKINNKPEKTQKNENNQLGGETDFHQGIDHYFTPVTSFCREPGRSAIDTANQFPVNPFSRGSNLKRTPPLTSFLSKDNAQNPREVRSTLTNSAQQCSERNDHTQGNGLRKLGEKISQLVDFVKPRTNIHKDIHVMLHEIQALYLQASDELTHANNSKGSTLKNTELEVVNKQTQTEEAVWPKLSQPKTPKRKRDETISSVKENVPKKKRDTIAEQVEENPQSSNNVPGTSEENRKTSDWVKVLPRGKKKDINTKIRRKLVRPDAIVIQTSGENSYAEILKKVKSDPKLDILGQNVKNIRKTAKGELLLQLNRASHQSVCEFKHKMEEVLGSTAEVRALTQEIFLEIRDIDEVTSRQDVLDALMKLSENFETVKISAIKSLRKAYGGTQTATIGLSTGLANQLLETSKIRIGWVQCRIREKLSPRRCFRCLDFSHKTANCKSPHDHTGKCLRCGKTGHKIKTCAERPMCLLCSSADASTICNHETGCSVCPYYQKALKLLKTRK